MVDDSLTYKKELLYLTYMLGVPGIPIIYYGDEIGMSGAGDPDNRRMMRFDDSLKEHEKRQLERVAELINLRAKHSALRNGDYKLLAADNSVFAFTRGNA